MNSPALSVCRSLLFATLALSPAAGLHAQVAVLGEGCPAVPGLAITVAGTGQIGTAITFAAPGGPVVIWVLGTQLAAPVPVANPCCTPGGHPLICCPNPGPQLWVNPMTTLVTFGGGVTVVVPQNSGLIGFPLGAQAAIGDPNVCLRMTNAVGVTIW